jgi:hypothetical protein
LFGELTLELETVYSLGLEVGLNGLYFEKSFNLGESGSDLRVLFMLMFY